MMTFKKIISAVLALTLSLALAACGSSDASSSGTSDSGEAASYKIGINQYGQHASLPGGLPPRPGAGRPGGG